MVGGGARLFSHYKLETVGSDDTLQLSPGPSDDTLQLDPGPSAVSVEPSPTSTEKAITGENILFLFLNVLNFLVT